MASRTLKVNIVGDASKLGRSFRQASDSAGRFGQALGRTAKYAGIALGAAGIGGLAVVLKAGISEFSEASKVAAQTGAVLKSTGEVANVTASQVDALAASLMRKSGVDDEQIKSGENMLLTFTKIRNEVGKGNDIFNQATKATLDLSVAMGKDMQGSAILVGKALNDPLKGMTALTRAGIQFTDAQKKSVKAMMAAGDTMGAQKLILKELNTQFGGSAEALGNTLPGKVKILKESFSNLSGELVSGLAPAFASVVDAASSFVSNLSAAKGFKAKLNVVWEGIQEAGMKMTAAIGAAVAMIDWRAAWGKAKGIAEGLAARFETIDWTAVGTAIGNGLATGVGQASGIGKQLSGTLMETVRTIDWVAFGRAVGPGLATALVVAFTTLLDPAFWAKNWDLALAVGLAVFTRGIGKLVAPLGASIAKTLGGAWERGILAIAQAVERLSPRIAAAVLAGLLSLPARVGALLSNLTGVVSSAMGRLGRIARFTIRVLGIQAAIAAVGEFASWVQRKLEQLVKWIRGLPGQFHAAAAAIGAAITSGILSGMGDLFGRVAGAIKDKVGGALRWARDNLGSTAYEHAAKMVGKPVADGIIGGMDGGLALFTPKLQAKIKAALDRAKAVVDAARTRMEASFSLLSDKLLRAFDAETSGFRTAAEMELDTINARRQAEALEKALNDALASGDPEAIARAREDIHMDALEKQAANERKAYEDQRNTMRENLERRLTLLGQHFQAEGATVSAALAAITKLMTKYGITFEEAGAYIGKSFMFGLQQAVGGAAATAGGVRGAQTGGNPRPLPPIVTQVVLDSRVIAESVRDNNVVYQKQGGYLAV